MLKIRVVVNNNEKKVFDVDSPTFEQAKKRILRLYPNAKDFVLLNTILMKSENKSN